MSNDVEYELHEVLGGLLGSLVRAQHAAAMAAVEFIEKVGFEGAPQDGSGTGGASLGRMRMVEFAYDKPLPNGGTLPMVMRVPLLTLFPIPMMRIKESTLDFKLEIASVSTPEPAGGVTADAADAAKVRHARTGVRLPTTSGLKPTDPPPAGMMQVQIRIEGSDFPTGLQKLLHVAEHSPHIQARQPADPPPAAATPAEPS
ncbi:MAG TPA: DUF2589 domain-containing protein [Azospirillaceae bacterium]|nr:DUF2589 domain-containing protein [Azospirillaceae bacterium]